jgi:hypothetical protein
LPLRPGPRVGEGAAARTSPLSCFGDDDDNDDDDDDDGGNDDAEDEDECCLSPA